MSEETNTALAPVEEQGMEENERLTFTDLVELKLDFDKNPAWKNFDDATVEELAKGIESDIALKVDGYIHVIKDREAEIEKAQNIKAACDAYIKSRRNAISKLKDIAKWCMEKLGEKKLVGNLPRHSLAIRKGGTSLAIEDVEALPKEFYVLEKVPLKKEIKDQLMKAKKLREQAGALKVSEANDGEYEKLIAEAEALSIPGAVLVTGDDGVTVRAGK